MAISFKIDAERDVLFITASGHVTDGESIAAAREMASAPHYHPDIRVFHDSTNVTKNEVTSEGIIGVLRIMKYSAKARRVMLLPKGGLHFGLARMMQAYSEIGDHNPPHLFHDRKEAIEFSNQGLGFEKAIE
jgi:hypothetical protein